MALTWSDYINGATGGTWPGPTNLRKKWIEGGKVGPYPYSYAQQGAPADPIPDYIKTLGGLGGVSPIDWNPFFPVVNQAGAAPNMTMLENQRIQQLHNRLASSYRNLIELSEATPWLTEPTEDYLNTVTNFQNLAAELGYRLEQGGYGRFGQELGTWAEQVGVDLGFPTGDTTGDGSGGDGAGDGGGVGGGAGDGATTGGPGGGISNDALKVILENFQNALATFISSPGTITGTGSTKGWGRNIADWMRGNQPLLEQNFLEQYMQAQLGEEQLQEYQPMDFLSQYSPYTAMSMSRRQPTGYMPAIATRRLRG